MRAGYLLGSGSFGDVYLRRMADGQGRQLLVAAKKVKHVPGDSPKVLGFNEKAQAYFENEQSILNMLARHSNHPAAYFSVGYIGFCEGLLLTEYCSGGELFEWVLNNKLSQDYNNNDYNNNKFRFAFHILNGLEFLHNFRVVHRDLKLENVFITYRPDGKPVAKIGDFGTAIVLSEGFETVWAPVVGTDLYFSHDVMCGRLTNGMLSPYSYATDIWAFGILLWMMLKVEHQRYINPDPSSNVVNFLYFARQTVGAGKLPDLTGLHPFIVDLLTLCWTNSFACAPQGGMVETGNKAPSAEFLRLNFFCNHLLQPEMFKMFDSDSDFDFGLSM